MSTEKHQLRVDVIGHTVVGGRCVANNGWHNEGGGIVVHPVPTAFHQGTKPGKEHTMSHQIDPTNLCCVAELPSLPAILCQRQDVTFVFDAGHAVHVLVSRRKNLVLRGGRESCFTAAFAYRLLEIPADSSQAACLHEAGRFQCSSVSRVAPEPSILPLFSQGGRDVSAAWSAYFFFLFGVADK